MLAAPRASPPSRGALPDEEAAEHAKDTQAEDPATDTGVQQAAQHAAQLVPSSEVAAAMLPGPATGAFPPKKRTAPISLAPTTTVGALTAEADAQLVQPVQLLPAAGATAREAKKRRITPVSTATSGSAGVAATHPAREPAIERTPEQYMAEVQRDAETIADTMGRFRSMTKTEMLYDDGIDLESVACLAQRMSTNLSMFKVYYRSRQYKDQQAEDERRETLKPVPIDQSETEIYDKYQSKLTGGNRVLYKCKLAGDNCICTLGPTPAGPGLKAIVQRHIDRVHCKSSKKRAEQHGLGEAFSEGWVV